MGSCKVSKAEYATHETAFIADEAALAAQIVTYDAHITAITADTWVAPTLLNSWVNHAGANQGNAEYMIDEMNFVHVRGLVKDGTLNTVIFTLPAGFRPANQHTTMSVRHDGTTAGIGGMIAVDPDGDVRQENCSGSNTWVSLDVITFKAAQ